MADFTTYFAFTGGPAAAEADWGFLAALWATDGVIKQLDNEFAVSATGTPDLNVHVATGGAWIEGYGGRKGTITDFAVTPDVTNPRKDIVVARANFTTHKLEILYRTGVAAGSPTAPLATRTAGITWDIVLAEVSVPANATSIPAGNITDRRPFTATGMVRAGNVTAAEPLAVPNADQVPQGFMAVVPVNGNTNFANITAPVTGSCPLLILQFSGTPTVTTDTGNLRLERNFVAGPGAILVLEWDGASWREITRCRESVAINTFYAGPPSGSVGPHQQRAMVQDDFPTALWSTSSPTALFQDAANITFTTNVANLLKMGKYFTYQCHLTLTSNGSGISTPGGLILTLPFTYSAPGNMPLGTYVYINTSGGVLHSGGAVAFDAVSKLFFLFNDTAVMPTGHQALVNEQLLVCISGKLT